MFKYENALLFLSYSLIDSLWYELSVLNFVLFTKKYYTIPEAIKIVQDLNFKLSSLLKPVDI